MPTTHYHLGSIAIALPVQSNTEMYVKPTQPTMWIRDLQLDTYS